MNKKNLQLVLMLSFLLSTISSVFSSRHSTWLSASTAAFRSGSDLTDRPDVGKSTISYNQTSIGIDASGLLYALQGRTGPVGFAYVASDIPIDASEFTGIELVFCGKPAGARFSVLVKDDQANQPQGELTFGSVIFEATGNPQNLKLKFEDFTGSIRGKSYPEFKLHLDKLKTFEVELTRSTQVGQLLSTVPLAFSFSLTGDVTLTNDSSNSTTTTTTSKM